MLMRGKMEDLPPLSSLMGSTHLGTKTLWKINQPSDLFLKNPVKKGNSLDLLQRGVNLVEAKYSRIVNREIITSNIERLDMFLSLQKYVNAGKDGRPATPFLSYGKYTFRNKNPVENKSTQ